MSDKVILKADRSSREHQIDEGKASEAITPCSLVEYGGTNDYQNHATAGGANAKKFALEPLDPGKDIEDDNLSGDSMRIFRASKGDVVHGLLAAGQNASSKGDFLESDGNGALQTVTPADGDTPESAVGVARETVNNTGSSPLRIKVEVI